MKRYTAEEFNDAYIKYLSSIEFKSKIDGLIKTKNEDKEKTEPVPPFEVYSKIGDKDDKANFLQNRLNMFFNEHVLKEDGEYGPKTNIRVQMALKAIYGRHIDRNFCSYEDIKKITALGVDPSKDTFEETFKRALFVEFATKYGLTGWKEGVGTKVWEEFMKEWADNSTYGYKNYHWCAMAQHELLDRAGLNLPYKYHGSTFALVGVFKSFGLSKGFYKKSNPKIGDIAIWNGSVHIGAVIDVSSSHIKTSEGNSKDSFRINNTRKSSIDGYIDIPEGYRFG